MNLAAALVTSVASLACIATAQTIPVPRVRRLLAVPPSSATASGQPLEITGKTRSNCSFFPTTKGCLTKYADAFIILTAEDGASSNAVSSNSTITVKVSDAIYSYTTVNNDTLQTLTTKLVNKINTANGGGGDLFVVATDAGGNNRKVIALRARVRGSGGTTIKVAATTTSTLGAEVTTSPPPDLAIIQPSYDDGINSYFMTASWLSYFNQIKSIFNSASGSATLAADVASMNFVPGFQFTLGTNVQAGSANSTTFSSNQIPILSSSGAGQAAQNMLYGGTFVAKGDYPVYDSNPFGSSTASAFRTRFDLVLQAGADIQNFKAGANVNTTSPPFHANAELQGYSQLNSTHQSTDQNGTSFTGALFVGGSFGYAYSSHMYARDYGFGTKVHYLIGQVSAGVLINNVVKLAVSRAFGPTQSYIDSASMLPVRVNYFKTWSVGITYQSGTSQASVTPGSTSQ